MAELPQCGSHRDRGSRDHKTLKYLRTRGRAVARTEKRRALVWKQSRKPDRDGHKHYQAKTVAGCYSVAAEYQPGKGFIGYRVTQSRADKRRGVGGRLTRRRGKGACRGQLGNM